MGAIGILVIGPSGTGKSASLRNMDAKTTYLMNVHGKPLPFKTDGYKKVGPGEKPDSGNMYVTDDVSTMMKVMQFVSDSMPHVKDIVIDDWQYAMSNEFMRKANEKGYEKFTQIALHIWELANKPTELRDDLTVTYLTHDEEIIDSQGVRRKKAKTIGKLVDEKIVLEGMFSIVLYSDTESRDNNGVKEIDHVFVTQNTGATTAKSPMGMFSDLKISNDLKVVVDTVNDFYGRK